VDGVAQTVNFGGLSILFDDRVLRPRPWTVAQASWAAELLPALAPGDVLELCSGAGQIGLLAIRDSGRRLICVDLNPAAAAYTRHNAEAAGLADCLEMREGRISEVLGRDERFPLIIADPPWVPHDQVNSFPEDPISAIDGGEEGMTVVRECLDAVVTHLAPGGTALLQVGNIRQAEAVALLLREFPRFLVGEVREFDGRGVVIEISLTPR
jgi:release factor glutamine methyltransferase